MKPIVVALAIGRSLDNRELCPGSLCLITWRGYAPAVPTGALTIFPEIIMNTKWILIALAIMAGAKAAPAQAQVTYAEREVAYVAAKWQEADFAREDALCSERAYRKPLDAARAAFEQGHPEYVSALALAAPRPEVVEVTTRKLDGYAKVYASLAPMFALMSHAKICGDFIAQRPKMDFGKRVSVIRDSLAHDVPPPPDEPLTTLAPDEVGPIVAAVLQHADVAMYLHPDVPGRVPVRVVLAAPYDVAPIDLHLYGAPVQVAHAGDRGAVQLMLKPHGDRCHVEVKYDPEGIFGSVDLERRDGAWQATGAKIYE